MSATVVDARAGRTNSRDSNSSMKEFRSPDGTVWGVDVRAPSFSNAMVVFLHPDTSTSRRNRYNWYVNKGQEARNVTARLTPKQVLESLTDRDLALLFRRSMPISSQVPRFEPG